MKILIIYELVPEETKFYVVNVSLEDWTWIQKTHGYYLNQVFKDSEKENEDACNYLNEWLGERPEVQFTNGQPITTSEIAAVVVTGFLL